MKYLLFLTLFILALPSLSGAQVRFSLNEKAIYGEDDRRMLGQLDYYSDSKLLEYSRSVLAQIPHWRVSGGDDDSFTVAAADLAHGLNFCPSENFSDQPIVSSCSAFLIGPDLLMTAGHCIKDSNDCKENAWVLDYDDAKDFLAPASAITFTREKTFQCKELLSRSNNSKLDYAIIRLDRAVTDRPYLNLRRTGKVSDYESLSLIGHPLGLPKIVSDNVSIMDNRDTYTFKVNADAFSGNSGSPVIGYRSGLVEGILISGGQDFEADYDRFCQRAVRCMGPECVGEKVQRSINLPMKYLPRK
jgi:V8-like Glu-specific endopeptidase